MKRLFKIIGIAIAAAIAVAILAVAAVFVIGATTTFEPPKDALVLQAVEKEGFRVCENSKFRKSDTGLLELYLEGSPEEIGAAYAALVPELIQFQENVFVSQIKTVVPSATYIKVLHTLLNFFNRRLPESIPAEYLDEINCMSQATRGQNNDIGSCFERQLNYHAAHDIGHAMQGYMLVGCSSFAAWDEATADSSLLVGRNFDFYFGDDFSKHKIVQFVRPADGIPFAAVSWPAMIGVVSGMNLNGLTVTINAAKGPMPTASKTPISILTRHILQYASTIDEAVSIAREFDTFVSESILVSSSRDHKAIIIEKTPKHTAVYDAQSNFVACTNHYQSADYEHDDYNVENIATSDSKYRHDRLRQLADSLRPLGVADAAVILRNRFGLGNADLGIGNEMSINQFICHHSVIFKPDSLQMWVSTSPWQVGQYVCYDIENVFRNADFGCEIASHERNIPADSAMINDDVTRRLRFNELAVIIGKATAQNEGVGQQFLDEIVSVNPNFYRTYTVRAKYFASQNETDSAVAEYKKALALDAMTIADRTAINEELQNLLSK